MTKGSDALLYLFVGGTIAVLGFALLFMGPLGWALAAFVIIGAMALGARLGDDEDPMAERVNCPECGSPNDADDEACSYCDEPL